MAMDSKTRHMRSDNVGHGRTRHGRTRKGKARQGEAGQGNASEGSPRQDSSRQNGTTCKEGWGLSCFFATLGECREIKTSDITLYVMLFGFNFATLGECREKTTFCAPLTQAMPVHCCPSPARLAPPLPVLVGVPCLAAPCFAAPFALPILASPRLTLSSSAMSSLVPCPVYVRLALPCRRLSFP